MAGRPEVPRHPPPGPARPRHPAGEQQPSPSLPLPVSARLQQTSPPCAALLFLCPVEAPKAGESLKLFRVASVAAAQLDQTA